MQYCKEKHYDSFEFCDVQFLNKGVKSFVNCQQKKHILQYLITPDKTCKIFHRLISKKKKNRRIEYFIMFITFYVSIVLFADLITMSFSQFK